MWNNKVNGNVNDKISKLEQLQFNLDEGGAFDEMRIRNSEELNSLYKTRADMLCQKARLKWKLEGDRNSKFLP